jgi:hypothetical protein
MGKHGLINMELQRLIVNLSLRPFCYHGELHPHLIRYTFCVKQGFHELIIKRYAPMKWSWLSRMHDYGVACHVHITINLSLTQIGSTQNKAFLLIENLKLYSLASCER